ncbi:MAG: response regulator transcription factor [Peptococcaceae bacterium]|nr:response regulator transcription factor [Peptococcaceae bacterium]
MRIEREALSRAIQILKDEGSLIVESTPRAGLTLFLSQIGSGLTTEPPGGIYYVNAAMPDINLFEHLAARLNLTPQTYSHSSLLIALKKLSPAVLLIDCADSLSLEGQTELRVMLRLFNSERVFEPQLAQTYIVIGTRSHWEDARLQLGFFSRGEVAALLKRQPDDHVALALYAWGRGSPELTRDLACALQCRESSVNTVYKVVLDAASKGKLHHVARLRPTVGDLRKLGLAGERTPLPAVSLAFKLIATQSEELTINRDTMEVRYRGRLLPLFPQETRILCHLAANPGRIYTPAQIYTSVTGGQNLYLGEKSLKAQMSRLRSRLPLGQEWIVTRRGLGYTFNPQAPCTFV